MARYVGPCHGCGVDVDRIIRPGRGRLCVECAIGVQETYNRTMALGTHPDLERSRAAGQRTGEAIAARKGPLYEKWKAGMIRAAMADWD